MLSTSLVSSASCSYYNNKPHMHHADPKFRFGAGIKPELLIALAGGCGCSGSMVVLVGRWVAEAADAVYCACDHKYIIGQWRCILKKKNTGFFKIRDRAASLSRRGKSEL